MLLFVTAIAIVLVVSFLCSIFESVLLSLSRPQVEVLVQKGSRAGRLLTGFKENIDVPIAAILIVNTAAHTIGASAAGASYVAVFGAGTLWFFSILFTIAVLFFTEIVPKTLGVTHAVALAAPVAHGIAFLTTLLRPFVALSERISRSIRGGARLPVTSVEEIRLLAALGRSQGAVGRRTAGLIIGAAQLRTLQAWDVMRPRDEVDFLTEDMSREQVVAELRRSGHSRLPLSTTRDLNDVCGVVYAKEILNWLLEHDGSPVDWEALRHEPLFVPRGVMLVQLLRTFQETRRHLVVIVDEYGGVDGIVSLEDVIEEIVGEIYDESDEPVEDVTVQADGSYIVAATVDLRKFCAMLGITWNPVQESSTIGGLVTEELEAIPAVGDSILWHGYTIEVLRADRRRARLLSVRPAQS